MKYLKIFAIYLVLLFLTFCSAKSDTELFESAQNLLGEKKYSESLAQFQEIMEKYPDSELAPKVLFEIAKIYGGNFLTDISSKELLEKSVEYYKLVFEKYPNSTDAPNSLFMMAFLQANYLNELETAKENYNRFMELYPENQLVPSARAELETLGISPEEILQTTRKDPK